MKFLHLSWLFQHLPNLSTLNLGDCRVDSKDGLFEYRFDKLRFLSLYYTTDVSEFGIDFFKQIINCAPNLTKIKGAWYNFPQHFIQNFSSFLPNVQRKFSLEIGLYDYVSETELTMLIDTFASSLT